MYFRSFKLEKSPMIAKASYTSDQYGNNAIGSLSDAAFGVAYSAVSVVNDENTENFDFTVIVAAYENGMLKSCIVENQSLQAGEAFSKNYSVATQGVQEIKTFILDTSTIKPLTGAANIK
jgi:hypothetical protein